MHLTTESCPSTPKHSWKVEYLHVIHLTLKQCSETTVTWKISKHLIITLCILNAGMIGPKFGLRLIDLGPVHTYKVSGQNHQKLQNVTCQHTTMVTVQMKFDLCSLEK
jgi:hypothetical protein